MRKLTKGDSKGALGEAVNAVHEGGAKRTCTDDHRGNGKKEATKIKEAK